MDRKTINIRSTLQVQKVKNKQRAAVSWNVECSEVGKAYVGEVVDVEGVSRVLSG